MADEKSVAEQVEDLMAKWNPPPKDDGFERIVGVQPEPGDTRATDHTPMEALNAGFQPASSNVDASRPDLYGDDLDDDDDADGDVVLKGKALDEALEERGLSKSGTADEKRARVEEYDADNSDDDDDDEDDN